MTHYLPAFTRERVINGVRCQQAACGIYVAPSLHHNEPECHVCRDYLEAENATFDTFDQWMETHRPQPLPRCADCGTELPRDTTSPRCVRCAMDAADRQTRSVLASASTPKE